MDEVEQYKSTIQQQKYLLAETGEERPGRGQHLQAQRADLSTAAAECGTSPTLEPT